jgi:hypothetical protein
MSILAKVAALIALLKGQQPNAAGNLEVSAPAAVEASMELDAFLAAQPVVKAPPQIAVWTVVKITEPGDHENKVGTVCGGNGESIDVDFGDGSPVATVNAAALQLLQ